MAIDKSTLAAYVAGSKEILALAQLTQMVEWSKFQHITDVRGDKRQVFLSTTTTLQDGKGCVIANPDSTVLADRLISAAPILINEALCIRDLEGTSADPVLPFGQEFFENIPRGFPVIAAKVAEAAKANSKLLWQGDTSSATASLKRFDGQIKQLNAASGVGKVSVTGQTSVTASNIKSIIEAIVAGMTSEMQEADKVDLFMPTSLFHLYLRTIAADCCPTALIPTSEDYTGGRYMLQGTNIQLVRTPGLNGLTAQNMVAAISNNLTLHTNNDAGFDTNGGLEFESIYDPATELIHVRSRYHLGTSRVLDNGVILYKNAAS